MTSALQISWLLAAVTPQATGLAQCIVDDASLTCGCSWDRAHESWHSRLAAKKSNAGSIFIGDMVLRMWPSLALLSDDQQAAAVPISRMTSSGKVQIDYWPGGVVQFAIDASFSPRYEYEIRQATTRIQEEVGFKHLEFIEVASGGSGRQVVPESSSRNSRYLFIKLAHHSECTAEVGMQPDGPTHVWLDENSCTQDTIQHELLHALGRYHEQCRPDRDAHIVVSSAEIDARQCGNFDKLESSWQDPTLRLPYDAGSIMHYGSCDFSCRGGYTMLLRNGSRIASNHRGMSSLDIDKMRALYPVETRNFSSHGQGLSASLSRLGMVVIFTAVLAALDCLLP